MAAVKSVYELKLHESVTISNKNRIYTVTRVPGGWLYESNNGIAFVPYTDKFIPDRG